VPEICNLDRRDAHGRFSADHRQVRPFSHWNGTKKEP
jgi:hypothetical protein